MADSILPGLTEATSWANGDLLYLVNDPAGTPLDKKIAVNNILQNITTAINTSLLKSSTGYSLTGSNASSMIDLAGTLNTTGSPAIIKVAMSNAASGATTKFLSFLAGASGTTSVFSVSVAGALTLGASGPTMTPNVGGAGRLQFGSDLYIGEGGNGGTSIKYLGFVISGTPGATPPGIFLMPDAANTLALRNGANAQTFNMYGTYTSASVYERGAVYADSNGFNIAHQQLGATKRPVRILGHDLASAEAVSALEINQTWNTSGNPVVLKMAITNTASGATSKFLSCLAGASGTTEVFSVDKAGLVIGAYGYFPSGMYVGGTTVGTATVSIGNTAGEIFASSSGFINWNNDTYVRRDAANTLALRNAANAQALNVYNTYTSGSVYERGFMRWVSNVLEIGTEHVGASGRAVRFQSSNTSGDGFHFRNTSQSQWTITFTTSDRNCKMYVQPQRLDMSGGWGSLIDYSAGASYNHTLLSRSNNGSTTFFGLTGSSAGVMQLNNGTGKGSGYGAALELNEMTSPAAPATNGVYIFAEDNGAGKTRLMARFATGATQQIAIEP